MKSSFYLKHDLDAREDEKMRALVMKMGARGYGIYWLIVEDLYRNRGRLARDYAALSWAYHEPQLDVKSVAEDFHLFYDKHGKIACRRVDRELDSRREASEKASIAGKASAAKRVLNKRSATVQPGEERRGEERKGEDITAAPSAVDLSKLAESKHVKHTLKKSESDLLNMQMPFGDRHRGRRIIDIPAEDCEWHLLNTPKLGLDLRRALQARVEIKRSEGALK